MRLLARVAINACALYLTSVLPGPPWIVFDGSVFTLLLAGAILGVFNAVVRPVALLLSLPFLILSLGLFYFVLNGLLLWLASFFLPGYHVRGLLAGILGSLVIGLTNWALLGLFRSERREKDDREG